MEKEGYTTPNSKVRPTASPCGVHCTGDVCSVCLSPFQAGRFTPSQSASKKIDRGAPVQTKCNVRFFNCCYSIVILTDNFPLQHTFHETCLLAARRWKSECPLCRSALSPVLQQLQWAQSNTMPGREEIVQAANRARNAVRYYKALLKR